MRRREFLLTGVGAAVAISGCLGGRGGGSAFDGDAIARTHRQGLLDAGSFTLEWSRGFSRREEPDREPLVYDHFVQFDLVNDRAFQHDTDSYDSSESFFFAEGDDVYVREAGGFTKDFSNRKIGRDELVGTTLRLDSAIADSWLKFIDGRARFSDLGTESLDGVTVTRYEAAVDAIDLRQFTDAHFTVLVDDAGIARVIDLDTETETDLDTETETTGGQHQRKRERYHFTAIGATTVEEPSWVAALR